MKIARPFSAGKRFVSSRPGVETPGCFISPCGLKKESSTPFQGVMFKSPALQRRADFDALLEKTLSSL
jgi:hypothetical protein